MKPSSTLASVITVYSIPPSGSGQVMAFEKESTSSIGAYGLCLDIDDVV